MRFALLVIPGVLYIAADGISDEKMSELKRIVHLGFNVQQWLPRHKSAGAD
jgi:hypothetical protein